MEEPMYNIVGRVWCSRYTTVVEFCKTYPSRFQRTLKPRSSNPNQQAESFCNFALPIFKQNYVNYTATKPAVIFHLQNLLPYAYIKLCTLYSV